MGAIEERRPIGRMPIEYRNPPTYVDQSRYLQFCLAVFVLFFLVLHELVSTPAGTKNEELGVFFAFIVFGPGIAALLWSAPNGFRPPFTGDASALAIGSVIASGAVALCLDLHYGVGVAWILPAVVSIFGLVAAWAIHNRRHDENIKQAILVPTIFASSVVLPLLFLAWSFRGIVKILYVKLFSPALLYHFRFPICRRIHTRGGCARVFHYAAGYSVSGATRKVERSLRGHRRCTHCRLVLRSRFVADF